jgi:hypothetical protein
MSNSEVVLQFLWCLENSDFVTLDYFLTPDFLISGSNFAPYPKQTFISIQKAILKGVHNLKFNARDIYEDGDKVFVTVNLTGTHLATVDLSFIGVAPIASTGKTFANSEEYLDITVQSGKICLIEMTQTQGGIITLLQSLGSKTESAK